MIRPALLPLSVSAMAVAALLAVACERAPATGEVPAKVGKPATATSPPKPKVEAKAKPKAAPRRELRPIGAEVRDLQLQEDFTEELAHRLVEWADGLRDGRVAKASEFMAPGFTGTFPSLGEAPKEDARGVAAWDLGTPGEGEVLDAKGWQGALMGALASLRDVDDVRWKVKVGEFELDPKVRGVVRLRLTVSGATARRVPRPLMSFVAYFNGEVVRVGDEWALLRLDYEDHSGHASAVEGAFFTDVTSSVGMERQAPRFGRPGNTSFRWRGGATGDVDGDGLVDFFLPAGERNHLFRNRGDGTFEDIAEQAGVAKPPGSGGTLLVDLDGDDDLDLVVGDGGWTSKDGEAHGEPIRLYENRGNGRFRAVGARSGLQDARTTAFSIIAADIDGDTDLDLYVAGYNPEPDRQLPNNWHAARDGGRNLLLVNEGELRFREVAEARGVDDRGWSYAAAFADYDQDGDADLYVANDYGRNSFFVNDGRGRFSEVAEELGLTDVGQGMSVNWGDVDADGTLDLYVGNMASSAGARILSRFGKGQGGEKSEVIRKLVAGNSLFRGDGKGGFESVPNSACHCLSTSWTWSTAFLDVDLDGLDDVFVTNGFISGDNVKDT